MGKAGKTTGKTTGQAPQLGQTDKTNDVRFQEVYDVTEALRRRLANTPGRLYGRLTIDLPYEASTLQHIVVTDKQFRQ